MGPDPAKAFAEVSARVRESPAAAPSREMPPSTTAARNPARLFKASVRCCSGEHAPRHSQPTHQDLPGPFAESGPDLNEKPMRRRFGRASEISMDPWSARSGPRVQSGTVEREPEAVGDELG